MSSSLFRGKSAFWVMTDTVSTSLLSILTMLVLARFAGPSDFGAASLIMGMTMLLNLYVEGFFHDALIQTPVIESAAYEQALAFVLVIAGAVIALTLIVACLLSGGPYGRYAWLALSSNVLLAFSGPLGIVNAALRRDMRFRDVARASVAGRLIGCTAAIGIAVSGHGLAALLAQNTIAAIAQVAIYRLQGLWTFGPRLSIRVLRPLLRFALPYALMHTLVALRIQGFALLVASMMGLTTAGYINIAFRLTTTPQIALQTTLTNFCFPLLARHQASATEFARAFALSNKMIATISLPLFVGLALIAGDLVPLLLGEQWRPSILLIQCISLGAAVAFSRMSGSLALRALGRVSFSFWNAIFQLVVTFGGLLLLRPTDSLTAVGLWLAPILIQMPITYFVIHLVAHISVFSALRGLATPTLATVAMALAVLAVRSQTTALGAAPQLVLLVAAGAIVFIALILLLDSDARSAVLALIAPNRRNISLPREP